MTDLALQTTDALQRLRQYLATHYNTLAPDHARIDSVELDDKGHVTLIGANPDESLLHSRTGRTPQEVLDSYERRM
jgi:hypothetical protein